MFYCAVTQRQIHGIAINSNRLSHLKGTKEEQALRGERGDQWKQTKARDSFTSRTDPIFFFSTTKGANATEIAILVFLVDRKQQTFFSDHRPQQRRTLSVWWLNREHLSLPSSHPPHPS